MKSKASAVEVHPLTFKHMKKGHPWVIKDQFTDQFSKKDLFLIAKSKGKPVGLLLNDPKHPTIKARLWTTRPPLTEQVHAFKKELEGRIDRAISRRLSRPWQNERENFYLTFGEADFLPGLFTQKLGRNIVLQYYATYWKSIEIDLIQILKKLCKNYFGEEHLYFWSQVRSLDAKSDFHSLGKGRPHFEVNEYGLRYGIRLDEGYDLGIYTDMASLRKKMRPLLGEAKKVLNLFCYTGAWSLYALKAGAEKVISVDLSDKYLDWLDENLRRNKELDTTRHASMCTSVDKALIDLQKADEKFDFILCDPPTASSDGNKKTSALNSYSALIPAMKKVLSPGGYLVVFLNTHTVSREKFNQKIETIIKKNDDLEIVEELSLDEDCQVLKTFPEGDYLKGYVLKKN